MTSNESRDPRNCMSASSSQLPADVHRRLSSTVAMEPGRRRHSCVPAAHRTYRRSSTRFEIDIEGATPKVQNRKWSSPVVNGRLGPDLAEEPDDQETGIRNEQERRASGGEAVVEENGRRLSVRGPLLVDGRRLSSVTIEEGSADEASHCQRRGSSVLLI